MFLNKSDSFLNENNTKLKCYWSLICCICISQRSDKGKTLKSFTNKGVIQQLLFCTLLFLFFASLVQLIKSLWSKYHLKYLAASEFWTGHLTKSLTNKGFLDGWAAGFCTFVLVKSCPPHLMFHFLTEVRLPSYNWLILAELCVLWPLIYLIYLIFIYLILV